MAKRLGELLIREGIITREQLNKALQELKLNGGRLGTSLAKLGLVNENELVQFLSKQYGVEVAKFEGKEIDPAVIKLIPVNVAIKYTVIPFDRQAKTLKVAMADPSNIFAIDDLKFLTGHNIEVLVASETAITDAISKYYPESAKPCEDEEKQGEAEDRKDMSLFDRLKKVDEELRKIGGELGEVIKLVADIVADHKRESDEDE